MGVAATTNASVNGHAPGAPTRSRAWVVAFADKFRSHAIAAVHAGPIHHHALNTPSTPLLSADAVWTALAEVRASPAAYAHLLGSWLPHMTRDGQLRCPGKAPWAVRYRWKGGVLALRQLTLALPRVTDAGRGHSHRGGSGGAACSC